MANIVTEIADENLRTLRGNVDPRNPNSIQSQFSDIGEDFKNTYYDQSFGKLDEDISEIKSGFNNVGTALASYEGPNASQWVNAGATTATVATNIIKQKIVQSLTAKRRVTIKALLNSVGSCFTQTPDEFTQNTTEKFQEFTKNLPKILTQVAAELGSEVAQDPAFQESIASLNEVQYLANVINNTYDMYNSVMKMAMRYEPYFPIIEIVATAASIWVTGGAGAQKFSWESFHLAMQELKKAIPLIVQPMKQQLYNKTIEVPAAFLGLLDFAASQESKSRFAKVLREAEEYLNISDAQFAEINRSLQNPIGKTLNRIRYEVGFNPKTSAFINNFLRKAGPFSEAARTLFSTVVNANKWTIDTAKIDKWANVRRDERSSTKFLRDLISEVMRFSERDIISMSEKIVDARDTTSKFYMDRQMFKLALEELKKDGALIDLEQQSYDELGTLNGGVGDRRAFTIINNKIKDYHQLLRLITGEIRADITEEIPVLDFYKKDESSLLKKYTDTVYFNSAKNITDLPRTGADAYKITDAMINSANPPVFNINLALAGYADAEYFFNTTSRIPEEKNIVVEYNHVSTPTAPGLLNGLFTKSPERDMYGNIVSWQWVDERSALPPLSDNIPLGAKFSPYFIWHRGNIIPRPLATTTIDPGTGQPYLGKATEWFSEASTFVNELRNRFTIPALTWRALGGLLHSVTLQSYSITDPGRTQELDLAIGAERKSIGKKRWYKGFTRKKVTEYRTATFYRSYSHKSYYPNKLKNLTTIDGTIWTSKNQTFGGKDWLVLDPATMGDSVVVYETIRQAADDLAKTARELLTFHPHAVFSAVVVKNGYYTPGQGWVSLNPYISHINIISPFEMVRNKIDRLRSLWGGKFYGISRTRKNILIRRRQKFTHTQYQLSKPSLLPDQRISAGTILYVPGDGTTIPSEIYLISETDLGFSLADNGRKALCTFYFNDRSLSFEVKKIEYFSPNLNNFKVTINSQTYTYEAGVSTVPAPEVHFIGNSTSCWIYTLSNIQVSDPELVPYFYALRSPQDYFVAYYGKFLRDSFTNLIGSMIAVGLPELAPGQTYASSAFIKRGVSFRAMDWIFDGSLVSNVVRGGIEHAEVIDGSISTPITIKDFEKLLLPWLKSKDVLYRLKSTEFPELGPIIGKFNIYTKIINIIKNILTGTQKLTYNLCKELDSYLGNNAPPWFSIGSGPTDLISEQTLSKIVRTIKTALEGTPAGGDRIPYPVRYLPGQSVPVGRSDSLYYRRYVFLNNRINKTEGHLAKAESIFFNWSFLKNSEAFKETQINSIIEFIDAIPTEGVNTLLYIPPDTEDEEGKFYIQEIIDGIADQIHDKCLLICAPCPVRNDCPFFDEASVLKKYVPPASSLDLWFKDNELDLLVYENNEGNIYLDLKDEVSGRRISVETMQDRHKVYTEIIHDEDDEIDLDTIRKEIAEKVDGFEKDGYYVDGLDWAHGGRYGSLILASDRGVISSNPEDHKYLYNALFIRDEDTEFVYEPTQNRYPVSVTVTEDGQRVTYKGTVRIKQPVNLRIFAEAFPNSDVYLVSDDWVDENGHAMEPIIYLNSLQNLVYDFDFDESAKPILSEEDPAWPGAADIAQWCVNIYKGMDPTPDQYWMPSIKKIVQAKTGTKEPAVVVLPGRPRVGDVIDTLTTESPNEKDLMRGKPMVKSYINFIRKMRIDLSSIRWSKSNSRVDIERKKQQLASMKTKLRLVVVRNP